MDEKPEGTPNPLNPKVEATPLDANPSESTNPMDLDLPVDMGTEPTGTAESEPTGMIDSAFVKKPTPAMGGAKTIDMVRRPMPKAQSMQDIQPMGTHPMQDVQPAQNMQPMGTLGVVTDMNGAVMPQNNLDPTNRPMEKAPAPEAPKPKKKKTGLIIGMIISLFIAAGCGVAAVLIAMNPKTEDAVALAMGRIINGEAPSNVAIDGVIDIDINDRASEVSNLKITLDAEAAAKTMINSSTAVLEASFRNGGKATLEFDEVYAANGDLYLKVDGVSDILADPYILGGAEIEESEELSMAEYLASTLEMLEVIDGEWIRISVDDLNSVIPANLLEGNDLTCLANLANDLGNNSNSISEAYGKNPFIVSTTKNLAVESKQNPIYMVTFDEDNFTGFMAETQNSTAMRNLANCLGYKNSRIDVNDVIGELQQLPELYVEVNENYNFTRLYLSTEIEGGKANVTADFDFAYPNNVNVPEPVEYRDFAEIMQQLLTSLYETDGAEGTEQPATNEGTQQSQPEQTQPSQSQSGQTQSGRTQSRQQRLEQPQPDQS